MKQPEIKAIEENKRMKFVCPRCGDVRLEEVMANVWQSSEIVDVDLEVNEPVYGEYTTDGGELDHYQCMSCGHVLKNEDGNTIMDSEGLVEWLKGKGMLKAGR